MWIRSSMAKRNCQQISSSSSFCVIVNTVLSKLCLHTHFCRGLHRETKHGQSNPEGIFPFVRILLMLGVSHEMYQGCLVMLCSHWTSQCPSSINFPDKVECSISNEPMVTQVKYNLSDNTSIQCLPVAQCYFLSLFCHPDSQRTVIGKKVLTDKKLTFFQLWKVK